MEGLAGCMRILGRDQQRISAVLEEEFRHDDEDKEDWVRERQPQSRCAETDAGVSANAVAEGFLGTEDSASDASHRRTSPRKPQEAVLSSSD